MGVTKFFGRFFIFLFCTFGAYLLFINLYVYSRGESSYFGFSSMINAFNDLPNLPTFDENAYIPLGQARISVYLPNLLSRIYNDAIGTALNLFGLNGGGTNIFNIIDGIANLMFAPLLVLFDLIIFVASIVWDLVLIVPFLFDLLKGTYNVPLT